LVGWRWHDDSRGRCGRPRSDSLAVMTVELAVLPRVCYRGVEIVNDA
jgi:hypothetical protein